MEKPIKYWAIGETSGASATDSTGNHITGTYQNTPTLNVSHLFTGDCSDVKVYNRAITKEEIAAKYKPINKSVIRRFMANLKRISKWLT